MGKKKIDLFEENFLNRLTPGIQIATLGSIFLVVAGFLKDQLQIFLLFNASFSLILSSIFYFIKLFIPKEKVKAVMYFKFSVLALFGMGLIFFIIFIAMVGIKGWLVVLGIRNT